MSFSIKRILVKWAAAASILLIAVLPFLPVAAAAEMSGDLRASLLTTELGDPKSPGNMQLAIALPPEMAEDPDIRLDPDAFRIHIYPDTLGSYQGKSERYKAKGIYVWRDGSSVFLDVRAVPEQDRECTATVVVEYVPDGVVTAAKTFPGAAVYTRKDVDVVLVVDISLSMTITDPDKLRVDAARTFMDMARRGGGVGRVALVTFNHEAQLVTPLIPLEQGDRLVSDLDMIGAEGMTNLDDPMEFALKELEGSHNPVVIFMTDGKNDGHEYQNTHLEAARRGVRIFAVGLSDMADHKLLKDMAEKSGGIYFPAITGKDLPRIYARLAAELGKRHLLQSTSLSTADGSVSYPIDASVRRMVAYADHGARIGVEGPGNAVADESGVFMGESAPGRWRFNWQGAVPNTSSLSVYGDTQFFLDIFPPRLRRDNRLAVGATLAQGVNPLRGAEVWVEPVEGVLPRGMRLYDDGLHGDGEAGDGVYANALKLESAALPGMFELTVRSSGTAWSFGEFVRQANAPIARTDDPPPAQAFIDGDMDFGILYPGETGTTFAKVELQSHRRHDLNLDLTWDAAPEWPVLSSTVSLAPGKRTLELEMTVPETAKPGSYAGRLHIGDGKGIRGEANARITVGGVEFSPSGVFDFGVVPPGTFISKIVKVPYRADKDIPLRVRVGESGSNSGDGDNLSLNEYPDSLRAGHGVVSVEAVVSAPMGGKDGNFSGFIELEAGPGHALVPVSWTVAPLAARPMELKPISGLPKPPQLEKDTKPLTEDSGLSDDVWGPEEPVHTAEQLPSPWDKALEISPGGQLPHVESAPAPYEFPKTAPSKDKKGGFWSAWWLYILAGLLLLLLLLLLIAYILYRLGKSSLARLLLASALANIIMLIIFVALLSSSLLNTPKVQPSVMINLVENDEIPMEAMLTDTDRAMLDSASVTSRDNASGSGLEAATVSIDRDSSSSADSLASAKSESMPEGMEKGTELAMAAEAEPTPFEERDDRQMSRRERKMERRNVSLPERELRDTEMAEPPQRSHERREETVEPNHEIGETRLSVESVTESTRAVWSDGTRPNPSVASSQGIVLSETPGAIMEKVQMDRLVKRLDPKGRRSSNKENPVDSPEPRVLIDDPARDSTEVAAQSDSEMPHPEPGVEELRAEARALGVDVIGRKPGAILPPGVSDIVYAKLEPMPRGTRGGDLALNTSPLGQKRSARGSGSRAGSDVPDRESTVPGSLGKSGTAPGSSGGSSGRSRSGDSGAVLEKRFDDMAAGGGDGGTGLGDGEDGKSGSRGSSASDDGDSPSPSPFAGKKGGGEKSSFRPSDEGGGLDEGRRGQPRRGRGAGDGDGDAPQSFGRVPGTGDGTGTGGDTGTGTGTGSGRPGGGGQGSSRGRGRGEGLGEGRYDGMAKIGGGGVAEKGDGYGEAGTGRSRLTGAAGGGGFDLVPLEPDATEWKRNDRRQRRRVVSVAASSVDMDSLLIVVGDFSRNSESAAENLLSSLRNRLGQGVDLEERLLDPSGRNLDDCLLALADAEDVERWSDREVETVGRYLKRGGHLWVDASRTNQAEAILSRLAKATDGTYDELPASHQLNDDEIVDALHLNGKLAAVVTYQGWRSKWTHGTDGDDGRALRFLVRGLNYFLSGDAETGISLEPSSLTSSELYVQPVRETMPEQLAGPATGAGKAWDEFGPETASAWRMPGWSDPGRISAISDGQGGRALRFDLGASAKGRAAVYRTLSPPEDFREVNAVSFDVYYDGSGEAAVSMVFTVRDFDGWNDYETPVIDLRKGWNSLRFDMSGRHFRSLLDDDDGEQALPGVSQLGRAGFFVYRDAASPAITLFRNIRLH